MDDDSLKSLVHGHLSEELQEEMSQMFEKRAQGETTPAEEQRIEELIVKGNEMTLKKSWARLILKDRGIIMPIG